MNGRDNENNFRIEIISKKIATRAEFSEWNKREIQDRPYGQKRSDKLDRNDAWARPPRGTGGGGAATGNARVFILRLSQSRRTTHTHCRASGQKRGHVRLSSSRSCGLIS